jgi:hypothetical protein
VKLYIVYRHSVPFPFEAGWIYGVFSTSEGALGLAGKVPDGHVQACELDVRYLPHAFDRAMMI